jgi:hypothetical protein
LKVLQCWIVGDRAWDPKFNPSSAKGQKKNYSVECSVVLSSSDNCAETAVKSAAQGYVKIAHRTKRICKI